MKSLQTASVCGLGKLGACIAATLAARGFEVVGIDIDPEKVPQDQCGRAARRRAAPGGDHPAGRARLRATQDHREAVATDVTFFIPPSPSLPDGSFSNEFLLKAMQPVRQALREKGKNGHLFVCSSTTTPGAVDAVLIPMLEKEIGRGLRTRLWRLLQPGIHRPGQRGQRPARAGHGADRRIRPGQRRRPGGRSTRSTTATSRASPACPSSAPS